MVDGVRHGVDGAEDKRVTIREAALLLGVSEGAVRKRVDRATLRSDKGKDGRVYVYLSDGEDGGYDNGVDASTTHASNPLISEMRSRIDFLEQELRRKDMILMNMTETMKALTSSPERQESPETNDDEMVKDSPTPEQQESSERRSWWRSFFGLE